MAMSAAKIWGSLHPFFEGGSILGRTVANRDFIRAFLSSNDVRTFFEAFHFFMPTPGDVETLDKKLGEEFPDLHAQGRFSVRLRRALPESLARTEYYCFHLSDPFVAYTELLRLRNYSSPVIFPVTAFTHSLSYTEFGEYFLRHIWPGVSKRDVVVATSTCGQQVIANSYDGLRRAYGLTEDCFPSPALRVIPLGVAVHDFPNPEDREGAEDSLRRNMRSRLGFSEDTVVFLTLARISYQSKMDLLPLLQAFKRAEAAGLKAGSYHFLLAGWECDGDSFGADIEKFCDTLGIPRTVVLRPNDTMRKALYAAADVFLSPVDNIQETFGLTMLEAAISSLPVIASDFDGYKDLVLDGKTGFLIPTLGPENTMDTNVRAAVAPAAEYHLRLAQQCVVDVKELGFVLARLGTDGELRASMGKAGRAMALEYSWDAIVGRYLELWRELAAIPLQREEEERLRVSRHPCEVDFGRLFAGHYTTTLADARMNERMLRWSRRGEAIYRGLDFPVIYSVMESAVPQEALRRLLFAARKPISLHTARKLSAELHKEHAVSGDLDFLLLWALKHDLLEFDEIRKSGAQT